MQSIAMQRSGLEAEKAALTTKLHEIEEHLARLEKAEAALHGHSVTAYQAIKRSNQLRQLVERTTINAPKKSPTIKQMVMIILEGHPDGLVALDILSKINERFNKSFVRTSLSPQLTRLFNEGKIHKRGKVWVLGPSPFGAILTGGQDMM